MRDVTDIEALEAEARAAHDKVIAAKDAEYIASGRLKTDVESFVKRFPPQSTYGKPPLETLEAKMKAAVEEATRQARAYNDSLWNK